MRIKLLKFINNERINKKLVSVKACDVTSEDICHEKDNASCTVYAYDECFKDFSSCTEGADDICELRDYASSCFGPEQEDICNIDWT